MGNRTWADEADTDASDHDVHVWQLATDLLDHDGIHAVRCTLTMLRTLLMEYSFKNPIQGMMQTNTVFSKFEGAGTSGQIWGIKAVYILMQFLLLGLGVYKINSMGLLPTTRSDWLAWESERQPLERAYFAFE